MLILLCVWTKQLAWKETIQVSFNISLVILIYPPSDFYHQWRDKTLILAWKKRESSNFLYTLTNLWCLFNISRKAFFLASVFSSALFLVSYIFCHWFLVPSFMPKKKKNVFSAGLEEISCQNVKLSRTPTHCWNQNLILLFPLATNFSAFSLWFCLRKSKELRKIFLKEGRKDSLCPFQNNCNIL